MLHIERTYDGFKLSMHLGGSAFSSCDMNPTTAAHDLSTGIIKYLFDKYLVPPDLILEPDDDGKKKLIEKLDLAVADGHQVSILSDSRIEYSHEIIDKIFDGYMRPGVELEGIFVQFKNDVSRIGYWFYRDADFPDVACADYYIKARIEDCNETFFHGWEKSMDDTIESFSNDMCKYILNKIASEKCNAGDTF